MTRIDTDQLSRTEVDRVWSVQRFHRRRQELEERLYALAHQVQMECEKLTREPRNEIAIRAWLMEMGRIRDQQRKGGMNRVRYRTQGRAGRRIA